MSLEWSIDFLFFFRFASDRGLRGIFSEEIVESGKELSSAIDSQLSINVSCEELQVTIFRITYFEYLHI